MNRLITESETGLFAIAVTPFTADGRILDGEIAGLVEFYLGLGASGLTILGMMGEAEKLEPEETVLVVERFLSAVAARVPVVVGISAAGLKTVARLSVQAMERGAAGVMIAPPGGLKHDGAVFEYFSSICETIGPGVPVVLQDFPLSTGVQVTVPVLIRLIRRWPQIVMLKHEDWPGLAKLSAIRASTEEAGRRISILTGNGGLFLPQELARGADGAMTGFAYPEMLSAVIELSKSGNQSAAETLFDLYLPLVRYEQQPGMGLAVRKEILFRRKAITSPALRRPGYGLSAYDRADIDRMMMKLQKSLHETA